MKGARTLKYTVVLERAPRNWSAYVPDIGGCIATGKTRADVERKIRSAIAFHFEGLRDAGLPIPEPGTWTTVVEVDVDQPAEHTVDDSRPAVPVRGRRATQRRAVGGSAE